MKKWHFPYWVVTTHFSGVSGLAERSNQETTGEINLSARRAVLRLGRRLDATLFRPRGGAGTLVENKPLGKLAP